MPEVKNIEKGPGRPSPLTNMKIKLVLDDGVKVNYAKFGELLADVKKIAGTKEEKDESAD